MNTSLAAELRAEFDSGFAHLPRPSGDGQVDVLVLRVGEQERALRLSDVAEVCSRPPLTPVPTHVPALVGLGASRGLPIAAYDLAVLTGGQHQEPRWLLVMAADPGIGLVVAGLVGYRHLAATDGQLMPAPERQPHLLDVPAILGTIGRFGPVPPAGDPAGHSHGSDLEQLR